MRAMAKVFHRVEAEVKYRASVRIRGPKLDTRFQRPVFVLIKTRQNSKQSQSLEYTCKRRQFDRLHWLTPSFRFCSRRNGKPHPMEKAVQAQIKENIKAPRHWPLWGEFTVWSVNSPLKGPVTLKMFPFIDVIMWKLDMVYLKLKLSISDFTLKGW